MIDAWLKEEQFSAEEYNAVELLHAFEQEMKAGLAGERSSLPMLPSYIKPVEQIEPQTVAFIDAGGTNLRVGLATFDAAGEVHFSDVHEQEMPGRSVSIEADAFYDVIVDCLAKFSDRFNRIGFCFSYPAEIQPNGDGKLLYWTKEIKIPALVGTLIGEGLIQALNARGIHNKSVVLLNDTVATLLAGCAEGQTFSATNFVGFILGTGTNTAALHEGSIINLESGGFASFRRTRADRWLDEQSEQPGTHLFEKAISGAYLGPLTYALLQPLLDKELFSSSAKKALERMDTISTIDLSLCVRGASQSGWLYSEAFSQSDRDSLISLFHAVVDRAALFSAVNVAAAVLQGGSSNQRACITVDGSTFYKTPGLARKMEAYLAELLDAHNIEFTLIQVEDAPARGAAMAALSQLD